MKDINELLSLNLVIGVNLQGLREEDYADPPEMSTQIRAKAKTVRGLFQSPTKLISIFV